MSIVNPLPYNIANGDPIDATPVMADFNQIVTNVNNNAADLHAQNTFSQPQNGVNAILPAQFVTLAQVQALLLGATPVGTIHEYAAPSVPAGYLPCDGAAVSRTTYAILFAVIGTTWGAGDGVSTFNVPSFTQASSCGSGGGFVVGTSGGAATHGLSVAEMPSHSHGVNDPSHAHAVNDPGHVHGIGDPGHAHAVNDPGHAHSYTAPGAGLENGGSIFNGLATQAATTGTSGTGIGIFASGTGISIGGATTGVQIFGSFTGISIQSNGSGNVFSLYHPFRVVTKMIRTGL